MLGKDGEWTERSGVPSARAPNARSWLKWGHEPQAPKPGCIVVFWRGSRTAWEGHVAIYPGAGERGGFEADTADGAGPIYVSS